MKTIFDSNIWIAFFNREDSQHDAACEVLNKIEGEIIIPDYVILESVTVLQNKKCKEGADAWIKSIFEKENSFHRLSIINDIFQEGCHIFSEQKRGLSFVDCILLVLSDEYKVETFDAGLEKAIQEKKSLQNSI